MYFFWQAFSIPLRSNTDSRVKLPKGWIPPHQCASFHLPWAHYYPLSVFAKGAGCLPSAPGGIEPPPSFTHIQHTRAEWHDGGTSPLRP